MDANQALAERFEEHRVRLRAVAYRMLGSLSEADDAVQEAWLRLHGAGAKDVENLGGWLTTVVGRVCLNVLRNRRTRPEVPLDPHVPDPVVSPETGVEPEEERSWPTPSGSRSRSSSTPSRPPNAWRSCCTTCSRCPSTRSDRWWDAPRRPLDSSRVGRDAGSRRRRHRTVTRTGSGRSSMPSSRRPEAATSTRSWRCSIPRSSYVPTTGRCRARPSSAVRRRSLRRRSCSRTLGGSSIPRW